ncbi:MAG: C4-type zinc ribbon domain-containing protein [Bryobacteraceae bacterium]
MQSDLDTIARVQTLDLRAAELRTEIAELPKQIARIEKQLEAHNRSLEASKAMLAANQKDRRACEGEIQVQQQKISKLREQMMSAKTNEQYRAFQHEIEFCEGAVRTQEDRIIELMDQVEKLESAVKADEAALAVERTGVEKQQNEARERTAADRAALDQTQAERKDMLASVNPAVAAAYERALKRFKVVAVADASNGRCSACHLELRPQFFLELRRRDKLMLCENCSRILHYNPPVAVDEHGPAAASTPVASSRGQRATAASSAAPRPTGSGTRVDMT